MIAQGIGPMDAESGILLERIRADVAEYCARNHRFGFDPAKPVIRLHEPTFGTDEIMAALECMLDTKVTMGPKVKAFERAFADHYGFAHGVMVNSGSSANLLAVAALVNPECPDRLHPGDEVIVSALSWSTTIWPLVQMGLVPVIVDIDPDTLNMDPAALKAAIGPRTRAVMPVHVYGNPCDMEAITAICGEHGLTLIEDCCEALDAAYHDRPVGKFGRVGTFSFYFSHHMTTLEGGICVTDDADLAELMRIQRAHGWIREVENPDVWLKRYPDIPSRFLFVNSGFNLRATELQGAMGMVQLPKLADFVRIRREHAAWMREELATLGNVFAFQQEQPGSFHSYFGFPITIRPDAPFTRAAVTEALNVAGVETRPIICGNIARQPGLKLFDHRISGTLEHADRVMERSFSFGNHQAMDDAARRHIAGTLRSFAAAAQ